MFFFGKKDKSDISSKPKKGRKSLITGIIVGGAVGSVISLLFAPARGSRTRAKVATKGKELWKDGSSKAEIFLEKYKDKVKDQIDE